jgi:hypothetical protein
MNIKFSVIVSFVLLNTTIFAQTKEWKTEKTKDGKITVKYCISTRIGVNSKEEQLVEYVASTTTNTTMKKLISIIKDVSKHKDFMGPLTSNKLNTLSENECIVYYFFKGVWPYPSSDLVAKMTCNKEAIKKIAMFSFTATPTLFEDKGVRRLDFYYLTYQFRDLENGNVEIIITSKFTPAVQLPAFILSTWFPDGPAQYLSDIMKLANESKNN